MLVRKAAKDDAGKIAEFAIKLVEQHVEYDAVRFARIATLEGMKWFYGEQMEIDNAAVLVAEFDGKVVGFAYITYDEKSYADLAVAVASLHDIYVEEEARCSGAGRGLVAGSVEAAKRFGATKLMLSVAAKNGTAQVFFEQAGFETTMHEMMLKI